MRNRIFATAATVATASLVATGTASAKDYPKKVEKTFVTSCVKAAKEKGGDAATTKQYKTVCKYTLNCIEGKLTFEEFKNAKATDPAIKSCIKKAKKHFS